MNHLSYAPCLRQTIEQRALLLIQLRLMHWVGQVAVTTSTNMGAERATALQHRLSIRQFTPLWQCPLRWRHSGGAVYNCKFY